MARHEGVRPLVLVGRLMAGALLVVGLLLIRQGSRPVYSATLFLPADPAQVNLPSSAASLAARRLHDPAAGALQPDCAGARPLALLGWARDRPVAG